MLHQIVNLSRRQAAALALVIMFAVLLAVLASGNVSATGQSTAEKNIQAWVVQLAEEEPTSARLQAQQQLEHGGDRAVEALTAALQSNNPVLRRNAAEVLGYVGAPRSIEDLTRAALTDADASVRVQAVWALSELNSARAADALERAAMLDPDARVRQTANDALAGLRWSLASFANKDVNAVRAFAVAPAQPDIVYLATADEVLVSSDAGKTWKRASQAQGSSIVSLAVSPANPDVVYMGTETRGLYKSSDHGMTWSAVGDSLGEEQGMPVSATAIAIDPQDAQRLYVAKGTWIGTAHARLFPLGVVVSSDAGATWTPVKMPSSTDVITRLLIDGNTLRALAGDQVLATSR